MSVDVDRSRLEEAVAADRAANAADCARMAAMDAYYESRMSWSEAGVDARVRPSNKSVVSELAVPFAISDDAVSGLLALWRPMHPSVQASFERGNISLTKCRTIKTHTDGAPAAAVRVVIEEIVRCAEFMAPGPLGAEIDRLLAEVDPEWDIKSRKQSRRVEPKVSLTKLPREMVRMSVVGTGEEGAEFSGMLTAQRARVCPCDGRSPDMLRHDAVIAQLRGQQLECQCGRPDCPYAPTREDLTRGAADTASVGRPDVQLILHASLEMILGISNAGGQLRGYGKVSADTCRKLAADASWQVIFRAGRRFVDTLTGGDDWYADDESDGICESREADASAVDSDSSCGCSCGGCCCGRAELTDEQKLADELLRRAHDRENRHATDESAGERSARDYDEWWRRMKADSAEHADPEVVLGRSRVMPAGCVPDDEEATDGEVSGSRSRTVSERIDYWRTRVDAEPDRDLSEFPDGHGGFDRPPAGAMTYAPSAALAQLVRGIFPTCVHPGCAVPSERCDLDHGVEFDKKNPLVGGWTVLSNLTPKCRGHHNLKTEKSWRYRMLPEGVLQVTDPLGNHYFTAL